MGKDGVLLTAGRESAKAGVAGSETGVEGAGSGGATMVAMGLCGVIASTLRDAAGGIAGWLGLAVPCKMSMSNWRALNWLSLKDANGKFGEGCCSA